MQGRRSKAHDKREIADGIAGTAEIPDDRRSGMGANSGGT